MNRNEIQNKVAKNYKGTHDNIDIEYAIDAAQRNGHPETVCQNWRWLCNELTSLYNNEPDIAAACNSYIRGWVNGMTYALNRALLGFLSKG